MDDRPLPPLQKPDLYVVARFLDRLRDRRGHSRSRLQLAVRLNYDLFRRYLGLLEQKGFVEVRPCKEGEEVVITEAGCQAYDGLVQWIHRVVGQGVI